MKNSINRRNDKGEAALPKRGKRYCYKHPRPAVTVDVALFYRATDEAVEVLLIKRALEPFKGMWSLPGGFVDPDEPLKRAAARELEEETGVRRVALEQFGAFGDPGRDPRGHTVSIGFTACLDRRPRVKAADDAEEAQWYSVTELPHLAFDHKKLVRAAMRHVFGHSPARAEKSSV